MSPLELIKQGIVKQDWELIRKGYNQMTGDCLSSSTEQKPMESDEGEEEEELQNPIVQPTDQKGHYDNVTVLITNGNPSRNHATNEAEREFNQKRAEARGPRKIRSNSKTEVICNECDEKFTSQYGRTDRKCKKCLMKHRKDLK